MTMGISPMAVTLAFNLHLRARLIAFRVSDCGLRGDAFLSACASEAAMDRELRQWMNLDSSWESVMKTRRVRSGVYSISFAKERTELR